MVRSTIESTKWIYDEQTVARSSRYIDTQLNQAQNTHPSTHWSREREKNETNNDIRALYTLTRTKTMENESVPFFWIMNRAPKVTEDSLDGADSIQHT